MSHTVADARYLCNPAFAERCRELRSFAAKNSQTVEETVKRESLAHTRACALHVTFRPYRSLYFVLASLSVFGSIGLVQSFVLSRTTFLAVLFLGALCCSHAIADGTGSSSYSGRDVIGGLVVRIEYNGELVVRERSGKQRQFMQIPSPDPRQTSVEIDGRKANFGEIKVGMRVQIAFYTKVNGIERSEVDMGPLAIISIRAFSNRPPSASPRT